MLDKLSKSYNVVREGTKVQVKNLFTTNNDFRFYTWAIFRNGSTSTSPQTYVKIQIRVEGKCFVREGEWVEILSISGFGIDRYRSKNYGYETYAFGYCTIKNLTPTKIDWTGLVGRDK